MSPASNPGILSGPARTQAGNGRSTRSRAGLMDRMTVHGKLTLIPSGQETFVS